MSNNADDTLAWKILANNLRSEAAALKSIAPEIVRLEAKQGELRARIFYLEEAITTLGGDLEEARKP